MEDNDVGIAAAINILNCYISEQSSSSNSTPVVYKVIYLALSIMFAYNSL